MGILERRVWPRNGGEGRVGAEKFRPATRREFTYVFIYLFDRILEYIFSDVSETSKFRRPSAVVALSYRAPLPIVFHARLSFGSSSNSLNST